MAPRLLAALVVLALSVSGCWHQADFPVFVQNATNVTVDLQLDMVRESDGSSVWNKTLRVEANAPYSESAVAHIQVPQARYILTAHAGNFTEEFPWDYGNSVKSLTVTIHVDRIDLDLVVL